MEIGQKSINLYFRPNPSEIGLPIFSISIYHISLGNFVKMASLVRSIIKFAGDRIKKVVFRVVIAGMERPK